MHVDVLVSGWHPLPGLLGHRLMSGVPAKRKWSNEAGNGRCFFGGAACEPRGCEVASQSSSESDLAASAVAAMCAPLWPAGPAMGGALRFHSNEVSSTNSSSWLARPRRFWSSQLSACAETSIIGYPQDVHAFPSLCPSRTCNVLH